MSYILARIVDRQGRILSAPYPAFQLICDGKPVSNFTLDQIEDAALETIQRRMQDDHSKVHGEE